MISAEQPWTVHDLLDEESQSDRVALEKLQRLGEIKWQWHRCLHLSHDDFHFRLKENRILRCSCLTYCVTSVQVYRISVFVHTGDSEALKCLLLNPHLRQLITSVDSAENKDKAMKDAMQEPLFTEFADQCLKIIEPKERDLWWWRLRMIVTITYGLFQCKHELRRCRF